MPTNVLANIARFTIVPDEQIIVSVKDPKERHPPALLEVCRQIRDIARPIFYRENDFGCMIFDFNIIPLVQWRDMRDVAAAALEDIEKDKDIRSYAHRGTSYRSFENPYMLSATSHEMLDWQVEHHKNAAPFQSSSGDVIWNIEYFPARWQNLLDWFELFHRGEAAPYEVEDYCEGGMSGCLRCTAGNFPAELTVAKAFEIIGTQKHQSWEEVMKMLPAIRGVLSAVDRRWVNDENARDNDGAKEESVG